jgi:hypothetical protein
MSTIPLDVNINSGNNWDEAHWCLNFDNLF